MNILIGGNGTGKSNLLSVFKMLKAQTTGRFEGYIRKNEGSMERVAYMGTATTPIVKVKLDYGDCTYSSALGATADGGPCFEEERFEDGKNCLVFHDGTESKFFLVKKGLPERANAMRDEIRQWGIYHLNDTSLNARVQKDCMLVPGLPLYDDFSNLASWLYFLRQKNPRAYEDINAVISLAFSEFDGFHLEPTSIVDGTEYIRLHWKQKGSSRIFAPGQLSDGTMRFICLISALMQPSLPPLIVIDEPELGLHTGTSYLVAETIDMISRRTQAMVATQSPDFLNYFAIDDVILVDRPHKNKDSRFSRLQEKDYSVWLEEEGVGDLWARSVIHEGPAL